MRVAVFGAGGHGREIMDLVVQCRRSGAPVEPVAYVIDAETEGPASIDGIPICRDLEGMRGAEGIEFVVALGSPAARRRVAQRIEALFGPRFATLIHPSARIGTRVSLGAGAVVCANATLTTDIIIGRHAHVNTSATITHDCELGAFAIVNVNAALSGSCCLGEGADIGTGAVFAPRVKVGQWAVVGAGAVVVRDVPANSVAVGVPAAVVRSREPGWHDVSED